MHSESIILFIFAPQIEYFMINNKKNLLLILALLGVGLYEATPLSAQRFTKKEQARRDARAANYFYGATFALTAGYVHSWMSKSPIDLSTHYYGQSAQIQNTHDSFNLGFVWDQALDKKWGLQTGLYYMRKGCDKMFYYDNGTSADYGQQLLKEKTEELLIQGLELQFQGRRFFPLNQTTRLSINAGLYVSRFLDEPKDFHKWDLGPMCGIGCDWTHLYTNVSYQPGVFSNVVDRNCKSRLGSLWVNVGVRFWKK